MTEQSVDNSVGTNPPVPQPHFDDERTLLTARRVVPLEKINAKVRHRRTWFLGGAFLLAMMLGAASALVAAYVKLRNAPAATTEVTQPEVAGPEATPAPESVAASLPSESPQVEETQTASEIAEAPKKESTFKRKPVRHVQELPETRDLPKLSEDEQLNRIRDAVLVDEWQERRARRVMRRERRRLDQYNHRDLSNLDEIFEGRRKPQ
jgi:hypothetical protein